MTPIMTNCSQPFICPQPTTYSILCNTSQLHIACIMPRVAVHADTVFLQTRGGGVALLNRRDAGRLGNELKEYLEMQRRVHESLQTASNERACCRKKSSSPTMPPGP